MKYIFHFVDISEVHYESVFGMKELMQFVQQAQTLRLKNLTSGLEEVVNLKYVTRIEELIEQPDMD